MTDTTDRKPLRVSFLIHRPSMSGGARVIARYARMLREQGHEVFLTGLGAPALSMKDRLKRLTGAKPAWLEPSSHFALEGLNLKLVHGRNELRAEDIPDADIVIATFWRTAQWLSALPPAKGVRAYFVQGHEAELPHADKDAVKRTYALDAKLITVSRWLIDILRENYGRADVALVPNAIDVSNFAPRADRRKQDRPTIGFMGSKNPAKRTDIAIRACEILKEQFPDLRVRVLAAHQPNGAYVMHDWFEPEYDPPQEKLAATYADCDAWLFTTDVEGYGLPLLEAQASGTPLVARPAGAAPELVTPENGALVDSADPARIAEAAARILSLSPDDWKAMSNASLASARAHDWTDSFEKFEKALYAAINDRWPPS